MVNWSTVIHEFDKLTDRSPCQREVQWAVGSGQFAVVNCQCLKNVDRFTLLVIIVIYHIPE
jgi:hypothetical protein